MRSFPPSPLESAITKIERAKEHLDSLKSAIESFAGQNRRIIRNDDIEKGIHTLEFIFPDIDLRTMAIAGDAACCLRSSLDHLVWQLCAVGLDRKSSPPKRSQFPILDKWNLGTFRNCLRHVPADAVKIIEELQPYNRGNAFRDSLLWQLNEIVNIDKHRRLSIWRTGLMVRFPEFPRNETINVHTMDAFDDRHMVSVPMRLKEYMRFDPEASISVQFGESRDGHDLAVDHDGFLKMHDFIRDSILPRFSRFFR